jgi:hypothetical protein
MTKQICKDRASREISQVQSGSSLMVRSFTALLTGIALSLTSPVQLAQQGFSQASKRPVAGPPASTALGDVPAEPAAHDVKDEYMFGPSILVNPVPDPGAQQRSVRLPGGTKMDRLLDRKDIRRRHNDYRYCTHRNASALRSGWIDCAAWP